MKNVLIVILVLVVLLAVLGVGQYNGLVSSSEEVTEQLANLDSQYQRRLDLIPNLVKTVKAFTEHETAIITQITEARAAMLGANTIAEKDAADAQLTAAIDALVVMVENYPELKSNETYLSLMDELAGTENRIAVARNDYNSVVKSYNLKVKRFPTSIFAGIFGYEQAEYFQAAPGAEQGVEVDFG